MRRHADQPHLISGLLDLIADVPGGMMAEVGSYQGESAALFAESGKFTSIHCVDVWAPLSSDFQYDLEFAEREFDKIVDLYPTVIYKHKMLSMEASKCFRDGSLDLVYIDASHDYTSVMRDLVYWVPKVRDGGMVAGHDWGYGFPGVELAIQEFFGISAPDKTYVDFSWSMTVFKP